MTLRKKNMKLKKMQFRKKYEILKKNIKFRKKYEI